MGISTRACFILGGFLACSLGSTSIEAKAEVVGGHTGVVVEWVGPRSSLEKAGIEVGDLIQSWHRLANPPANSRPARGVLESPFDWLALETEEAPRGTVELHGMRQGLAKVWSVPAGEWRAKVRPAFQEADFARYRRGLERIDAGDLRSGIDAWQQIGDPRDSSLQSWRFLRIAEAWEETQDWAEALAAYRQAVATASDPEVRTAGSRALAKGYEKQGDLTAAIDVLQPILEQQQRAGDQGLDLARSYYDVGRLAWQLSRLKVAQEHSEQALEIRQRMAPGSLKVAESLVSLAIISQIRGDLDQAEIHLGQVQRIVDRIAPESQLAASAANNLAIMNGIRGDVELAVAYCQKALRINEKIAPNSRRVAVNLTNLAIATSNQGDYELALEHLQRALKIYEQLAPGNLNVINTLATLGEVALKQNRLALAKGYLDRGLALREEQAPESIEVAEMLLMLGAVARGQGQRVAAVQHTQRAVGMREALSPGSLSLAEGLFQLGVLAQDQGVWNAARAHFARALKIQEELAPDSLNEAKSLRALGLLSRRSGQLAEATSYLQRSIDALEAQAGRLSSSEDARGSFRSLYHDHYRDLVELLVDRQRPEEAFAVLERSRARSFLALLAERDSILGANLPADLKQERRQLAMRYERTQAQLAALSPIHEPQQVQQLVAQLKQLQRQRQEVIAKVREISPKLAAVEYPQSLSPQEVRDTLDPGTVMVSYSVGKERTDLFIVTSDQTEVRVQSLDLGESELRSEVERFRQLILEAIPGSGTGASRLAELEASGRRLYRALIEPAEDALARGERLLIVPDGPLHQLPFAAVIRDVPTPETRLDRPWQYLVEWQPVHSVLSATVYAELKKRRRVPTSEADSQPLLVAFGDPKFPPSLSQRREPAEVHDIWVRSALARRSFDWQSLPFSRDEVEGIAAFHDQGQTYLGDEATEERAKTIDPAARLIHFATHSHLDSRFPLSSALVLTLPEGFPEDRENGLLQAWEIFESVRLDADLVTLSACQSALGEEQGGEGLIGLTRAFQYAGARTVAATLWSVADQTTPQLMVRFYHHLKSGQPKDRALQLAQIDMIRGRIESTASENSKTTMDASAPYFWAAFQIIGDWR